MICVLKNVDGISTHNILSHSRLIFTKCTSVMVSLMIKYILFFNTKATKLKLIKGDSKKYCYVYHNDIYGNVK